MVYSRVLTLFWLSLLLFLLFLQVASLKGLSTEDQKEIDRWVELYEFHDKYTYVGKLVQGNPVDEAVEQAMREEQVLVDIQRTATDTNVDVVDELIACKAAQGKQQGNAAWAADTCLQASDRATTDADTKAEILKRVGFKENGQKVERRYVENGTELNGT